VTSSLSIDSSSSVTGILQEIAKGLRDAGENRERSFEDTNHTLMRLRVISRECGGAGGRGKFEER